METKITKRVEASWKNWKKFSGVPPVKLKKVHINGFQTDHREAIEL